MEIQALLLGLEPLTALAIGLGALVLAPVIATTESAVGGAIAELSKNLAKTGLIWSFDAFNNLQIFVAEAGESFQDLVAEARADQAVAKAKAEDTSRGF